MAINRNKKDYLHLQTYTFIIKVKKINEFKQIIAIKTANVSERQ